MAAPLPTNDPQAREAAATPSPETEGESSADQILALTAEIQERDRLVELLTERLEQAAEQLDRIRRTGADRGPIPSSASQGSSLEVTARQLALADRLESVLVGWEAAQAPALLTRIEARMEQLASLIRESGSIGHSTERSTPAAAPAPAPSSGPEGWDALKARLLGESPPQADASDASAGGQQMIDADDVTEAGGHFDPPVPIDAAESDPDTLREAVFARDNFIASLIARCRQERKLDPPDWESLTEFPDELRQRVEQLEHRLNEEVMREELALSLERARLGREQAQLEQLRTRLEKEIRRLGRNPVMEAEDDEKSDKAATSWSRMFGRKKPN